MLTKFWRKIRSWWQSLWGKKVPPKTIFRVNGKPIAFAKDVSVSASNSKEFVNVERGEVPFDGGVPFPDLGLDPKNDFVPVGYKVTLRGRMIPEKKEDGGNNE